jgi:hypothetical protein
VRRLAALAFSLALICPGCLLSQQYTRGIGVYPGDPQQYDGPTSVIDSTTYRNLALHRPTWQSSAYDYNLTAQLVTDGIKEKILRRFIVTSTSSGGILNKQDREVFLDGNVTSSIDVTGDQPWVEFDLEGAGDPPELDRLDRWRALDGSRPLHRHRMAEYAFFRTELRAVNPVQRARLLSRLPRANVGSWHRHVGSSRTGSVFQRSGNPPSRTI